MRVFMWKPETYGLEGYVLAKDAEAAKKVIMERLDFLRRTDPNACEITDLAEWVLRDPDVSHGPGELFLGEVC